jgi:hypothetical protein
MMVEFAQAAIAGHAGMNDALGWRVICIEELSA